MRKMLRRMVALGCILCLCVCVPVKVSAENPTAWAQALVAEAIAEGLVPQDLQSGYTQVTTRAAFCALAVTLYEKVAGAEIAARKEFSDTDDVNVQKMAGVDVVSGVGDGKFDPDGELTREQAATVLAQLAAALGKDFPEQASTFTDNAAISGWAQAAVGQVQAAGIMGGVGNNTFSPKGAYTREQSIVTMLYLFQWAVAPVQEAQEQIYPMSALVDGQMLWGYVDNEGAFVMAPQFAYASEWHGEYGIVAWPDAPEMCSVINRAEERIAFDFHPEMDRAAMDSFPLEFVDGAPNVFFVGNCVLVETDLFIGMGEYPLFSLTDRKYVDSIRFDSFSDGMICGHYARGDRAVAYDADGRNPIRAYSWVGAFHEGVAISWGRLLNKQGEIVSDVDLLSMPEITVIGLGGNTCVGDSSIFVANKQTAQGWEQTDLRGVIRADGTVILPAEYSYVRLTLCKQILTGKPGETYRLHDALGKEIYKFPTYVVGAFYYDESGFYLYRDTNNQLIVLSTDGVVMARIPVEAGARHEFISGLVRVVNEDGACAYYDVNGKLMLVSKEVL